MIRYVAVTIFCIVNLIELIIHPESINTIRLKFYGVIVFIILLESINLAVKCYFKMPQKENIKSRFIWNGKKFVEHEEYYKEETQWTGVSFDKERERT